MRTCMCDIVLENACTYVCMCTWMNVCMYVYMYVLIRVH